MILLISCQKEKEPELSHEIPQWLQPRFKELKNSEQHCWDCSVTKYTYKDDLYFNVYCGYWSCAFCEFYNNDGKLVSEIENFEFEDFISKRNNEIILWICPDSD